ncbi:uncharacterized protein PV06_09794 [Exophiala oligosperma]|uniref:Uncharacterized protein n=1 Tax=Exophiala oligosperma TaxID=215243 RepID=A0A0D2BK71_9EURO|nr:uncharacterized protein PV06_09794 [Exophiala oligosperma]KIW37807.1 hypothetical protein PV06_09794 [Exophiala oligosperma]
MFNMFSGSGRHRRSDRSRNSRYRDDSPPERHGHSHRHHGRRRRRRSEPDGIPPPAPSPPPAYEEYPVSRSPPRGGGGRDTTPEGIRYTNPPREPRRTHRTYADPGPFMSGARSPFDDDPLPRRTGVPDPEPGVRCYVPDPRHDDDDDDPYNTPPRRHPDVWYDRPDSNGFRPARTSFDTRFSAGRPSYYTPRSGGLRPGENEPRPPRRRVYLDPTWPGPGYGGGGGGGSSTNRYRDRSSGYFRFSRGG